MATTRARCSKCPCTEHLIRVGPDRASLFVQFRYGFTPQAAAKFCSKDVRRRPKFSIIKEQSSDPTLQWLQTYLLVLNHDDTWRAWEEFNIKFPTAGGRQPFAQPFVAPPPGMNIAGRAYLQESKKATLVQVSAKAPLQCNCRALVCMNKRNCTCTAKECDNSLCYSYKTRTKIMPKLWS